ncbi:MAG TPA: CHC2 zinc finger domain-containing protein [Candidatus Wujingus californicus]|uniref:CHC2 zinc finger domain-containing protein n=1 Tax=Candidatus Wujingus californicus TaxID=3367618 RepID=UPI004029F7A6
METVIKKPDIIEIFSKEGISLQQRGRYLWACCPFHSEKTASFAVNSEKQRFHCYGCHASGDSIDFIMRLKGLSFRDALSYLGITNNGQVKPSPLELKKREVVKKFRRWMQLYRRAICELLRLANRIDLQVTTPEGLELSGIGKMYLKKFVYEYHLDILNGGCDEAKFKLYQEYLDECNKLHS